MFFQPGKRDDVPKKMGLYADSAVHGGELANEGSDVACLKGTATPVHKQCPRVTIADKPGPVALQVLLKGPDQLYAPEQK